MARCLALLVNCGDVPVPGAHLWTLLLHLLLPDLPKSGEDRLELRPDAAAVGEVPGGRVYFPELRLISATSSWKILSGFSDV